MAPVKAPSNLPDLVKAAFATAHESGHLTYFPTQVAVLRVNSIPFQLRFSPALANKPKAPKPDDGSGVGGDAKPFDPFETPPPQLFVAHVEPEHYLVLNKFAVVPEHFILATTAFELQTHLLSARDLAATRACIEAYESDHPRQHQHQQRRRQLFAFFNSGPHSGASQAHRHVQLLPVDRMRDGLHNNDTDGGGGWDALADSLLHDGVRTKLPFMVAVARISETTSADELRATYLGLYRDACAAMGVEASDSDDGEAAISYNLAMTRDTMVLCPRAAEGADLPATTAQEGQQTSGTAGTLALNGTLLAGTALVRNQSEWDTLRSQPHLLHDVLAKIGVPVPQQTRQ